MNILATGIGNAANVLIIGSMAVMLLTAGCGRHHGHHARSTSTRQVEKRVDRVLRHVDATKSQEAQVHEIMDQIIREMSSLRADHAAIHDTLIDQWQSNSPDQAALNDLIDQQAEHLREIGHSLVDEATQIHEVLTPEQRQKLSKKLGRHRG